MTPIYKCFDYQIHDGYDATTQELMHSCGNTRPSSLVSSSNVLFIRLNARGSGYGGHDVSTILYLVSIINYRKNIRYVKVFVR